MEERMTHDRPRRILREAVDLLWSVADGFIKRRLLIALGLVGAGAIASALTPVALKMLVDVLTGADPSMAGPFALVAVYVLGNYLTRFATEMRHLAYGYAEQRVRRRVGLRMFEHLVRLPLRSHLERKTGAMGETAEQGLRGYQLLINHMTYTILPVTIELLVVAAVLIHLGHTKYLAVIGIASLAYAVAFYYGARAVKASARLASTAHVEAHAMLTDTLLNHETVKYFNAEPIVCTRYDAALGNMESAWRRFFSRRATNGAVVATIFAASLGVCLFFAANDVARGAMTVGDFLMVNAYVIRLVQPLEMIGHAVRDVAQGMAFLRGMLDLLRERTEGDHSLPRSGARAMQGELAFDNVTFSYRKERVVLSKVGFAVAPGRTTAIVGMSGSGKSSLVRLLFRLYEPDSGRITLDGTPIAEMPIAAVRRVIAVVPQDTMLFHDTIASNIGFGRHGATHTEIEEAARIANLHDFIASLPEGYETLVGERGLKLSGGERQRVAIARAALKRPRIFVFDEATSSLDSRTEREILRNLVDLSSRSTTLVIAHRLSTVVHADEIIVLDRGVIVERGTHEELRARNGSYAALWNAQQAASPGRDELSVSVA